MPKIEINNFRQEVSSYQISIFHNENRVENELWYSHQCEIKHPPLLTEISYTSIEFTAWISNYRYINLWVALDAHGLPFVMFCYVFLLLVYFTHILQGYFTGTGAIIWLNIGRMESWNKIPNTPSHQALYVYQIWRGPNKFERSYKPYVIPATYR